MLCVIGYGEIHDEVSARSWVSRLDSRAKILCVLSFLIFILLARGFPALIVLALSIGFFGLFSRCSPTSILRALKPFLWLVAVTFLLNALFTPGRVLLKFWGLTLTYDGLTRGGSLALKLVFMISVAHILLLTTPARELTDGLVRLLSPLRVLRLPVSEIGMVSTLTLKLIPGIREEARRIFSAQKARGAFGRGIVARAKGMLPMVVPLLSSCLQRGVRLSRALESRGYEPEVRSSPKGLNLGDCLTLGAVWLAGSLSVWMGLRAGTP